MKKALLVLSTVVLSMSLVMVGCSSGESSQTKSDTTQKSEPAKEEKKAEPLTLTGTWKSTNSDSPDSWREATIEGNKIMIYWVSKNGDSKSLYWAGSVEEPTGKTINDTYSWESKNDTEQTSILTSTAETKEFKYENKQLTYEASAMGTTKTVRMEKIS